jgi:hypothetical protein
MVVMEILVMWLVGEMALWRGCDKYGWWFSQKML